MKKLITLLVTLAMVLSVLGVAVSAASYQPVANPITLTLKQAKSENVNKDG